MIRFILLDIEGTTTDIHFVHKVLFPYAKAHLKEYVETHRALAEVQACLQSVQETLLMEEHRSITDHEAIETMQYWIDHDRKHTALKTLQGLIWQTGYETGAYQGHVYADVSPCLAEWTQQGLGLGIYSSGSVWAQQLLFQYSIAGDLRGYFSHYFDTRVGAKQSSASYRTIASHLEHPPQEILFLSDVPAELDAALQADFQVTQVLRDNKQPHTSSFPVIQTFRELNTLASPV